jgi:hypothetical protein
MKMTFKKVALLSPLLMALTGGCATKALWHNGKLDACNEPAGKLNLRLFEAKTQTNLLVVYNEFSERNEGVHTRAYWLEENQTRVGQHLAPHFTGANAGRNLAVVPVYYAPIPAEKNLPRSLCAVVATNQQCFTLYLEDRAIGTHDLPVYNDGKGQAERIALTPVAVAADVVLVGSVVGWIWLVGYAEGHPDGSR